MSDTAKHFGIGMFVDGNENTFIGVVAEDRVAPITAFEAIVSAVGKNIESINSLYSQWDSIYVLLESSAAAIVANKVVSFELSALKALPPSRPSQIIAAGANYYKHVLDIIVAEAKRSLPEGKSAEEMLEDGKRFMTKRIEEGQPYAWNKSMGSLCGANDAIIIPKDVQRCDWELELAVIIGKRAYRVDRRDALSHVAGYTIGNDVTARDYIYREDMKKIGTDWLAAKGRPTFLPLGPYMVPRQLVPNPQDLTITLKHNGKVMQNECTADMMFDVARLIEYISALTALEPGDVILTGSPAGNGEHWGVYMKPGDVIESSITGLGAQKNICVAE